MINKKGCFMTKDETDIHLCDQPLNDAIIKMFKGVKTAIDIGCGNGSYIKNFIDAGIDCIGYDGSPLTLEITSGLPCYIQDFSDPVDAGKFDLVVSLEVGEHIPKQFEQIFIDNVCRAAKRHIVLSWATEGQGGRGHVNCRNNDYVIKEMESRGYVFDKEKSDILKGASTLDWFKNTVMVFRGWQSVHDRGYYLDQQEKIGGATESTLVESIMELYDIKTVVDIGCGAGRYTKQFIEAGVSCTGYDGNPLTPEMTDGLCSVLDITEPVDIGKFDLVFCLEVAEHIPEEFTDVFLKNLYDASDWLLVISWATVGLEWEGHVNCRNNDYVIDKLASFGFTFDAEGTKYTKDSVKQWLHIRDSVMIFEKC